MWDRWDKIGTYSRTSINNVKKDKKRKAKKAKRLEKQAKRKQELQESYAKQSYLDALKRNKRGLVIRITEPERTFKNILDCLEIKYTFQKIFMVNDAGYIVDFYLPEYLMVIEIDGNNHYEEIQDHKDQERTQNLLSLKSIGHVLRFDNQDVLCMKIDEIKRILAIKICPFIEDLLA